mgnify:CR=1 FL=1
MDMLELVGTMAKRRKDADTTTENIARLTSLQLKSLPIGELK